MLKTVALSFLAAFSLAAAFSGPGFVEKLPPRIAVAEGHSQWERLHVELDRDTFGTISEYNYSEWVRTLERLYGKVRRLHGLESPDALDEVTVIIIKTPTRPFSQQERRTIREYVERGGGLFLVGDHTNVFGMNTYLNQIARDFGLQFQADAVDEIEYHGGLVSAQDAFPRHELPGVRRPMRWMTSCSLQLSYPAVPLLWCNHGFGDHANYGVNNFFGDHVFQPGEQLAPLCQAATAKVGAGRVLAFADSTLFSNFSIFFPGVRELAFGGVEWLRRREVVTFWRYLLAIAGVILLWRCFQDGSLLGRIGGASLGLALACAVSAVANGNLIGELDSELSASECVFDQSWSLGRLPLFHQEHDRPYEYWSLFKLAQRAKSPMRVAVQGESPFTGRMVVMVLPKENQTTEGLAEIRRYVEAGGSLVVFDDGTGGGKAVQAIAGEFGMQVANMPPGRSVMPHQFMETGPALWIGESLAVWSSETLVEDSCGIPLVGRTTIGKGSVVVAGLSGDLSDAKFGSTKNLDSVRSLQLAQLVYRVMDGVEVER